MAYPDNLHYTKDHEWISIEGNTATVGITDFAQHQLGDIVFVDIDTVGETLESGDVFGTVEAVKTVSDLFLPIGGTISEVNAALDKNPELINTEPYGAGWIIKMEVTDAAEMEGLLKAAAYQELVGE